MAKVITIDELYSILRTERIKGNGSKKIMMSSDDEGNEFHPMYFGITEITDDFSSTWFRDIPFDQAKKECVILG
jgi:hypothetical protein